MSGRRCLSLLATLVASSTAFSVVDDDGEGAWPAAGETLPTDMLTLVKTLMKDKGIESAKVDEEGSGTEATAVNLRNRLMSLEGDLQEQSTRWK